MHGTYQTLEACLEYYLETLGKGTDADGKNKASSVNRQQSVCNRLPRRRYHAKKKGYRSSAGFDPSMYIHELTYKHISDVVSAWPGEGIKLETCCQIIGALRRATNTAKKCGVRTPKIDFSDRSGTTVTEEIHHFTKDEEKPFLEDLANSQHSENADLTILLFYTGMRIGEALSLKWSQVEFDENRILVRRHKTNRKKPPTYVGISKQANAVLARRKLGAKPGAVYVSPCLQGTDGHRRYGNNWFVQSMNRLGFNAEEALERNHGIKLTIHCLRKTFASRLLLAGTPMKGVSVLLGHSHPFRSLSGATGALSRPMSRRMQPPCSTGSTGARDKAVSRLIQRQR